MIVMPDIQLVCTSSTECDLRFYDVAAKKFDFRVLVGDTHGINLDFTILEGT